MSRRAPPRDPHWWTGVPEAYLDLRYRWLPRRLAQQPARLRVWNVGFEDGSETLLLMALLAEGVGPEVALDLLATDNYVKLCRAGRRLELRLDGLPAAAKRPLILADLPPAEAVAARREVARREVTLGAPSTPRAWSARLRRLAAAGKTATLLSDILAPAGRGAYRIIDRTWRWRDPANGRDLNPAARKRVVRFVHQDLTRARPRAAMDLVVCTNVLPHLALYAGAPEVAAQQLRRAVANLEAVLAPGGALMIDRGTASRGAWAPLARELEAAVARLRRRGVTVWVARAHGLVPI